MLWSVSPESLRLLFGMVLVATATSVYMTNVRRFPRIARMLARNSFLLTLLLMAYQFLLVPYVLPLRPAPVARVASVPAATGDSIVGGPSLSVSFLNTVLSSAGSPAAGSGQSLYDLSVTYRIDDAYALSTFQHESTYGKYGVASVNHSLGNIICAAYPTCNGRFRWYATWQEGYEDFYRLIAREYVARGCRTLACIIPVYAPPSENNTPEYVQTVRMEIVRFRSGLLS